MPDKSKSEALEKRLALRAKQSNCQSYVEFLANHALIQSYLDKGYNVTTIWQALFDEGLITFKYSTFSKYLRKLKADPTPKMTASVNKKEDDDTLQQTNPVIPVEPINQGVQPKAAIKLNLPDGMSHNPMINPKDLI